MSEHRDDLSAEQGRRQGVARGPRRLEGIVRALLEPLFLARPGLDGWRLLSWDAEQGITLVFQRSDRFVLVECEARDEALDCYARTAKFNVCARSQFTPTGELTAEERRMVDAVVRFLASRESMLVIDQGAARTGGQVREIEVDRMLVPEGANHYYLNAYAGCMIGCSFCYVAPRAELSRRIDGAPPPPWGRWVDVKVNAREVLAREVREHPPGTVRMSPILTDPYQPIEKRYRITRQCVEVLIEAEFRPVILTRESRVLDDLDLLTRGRSAVGFSIPTDDDGLRRVFEPGADTIDNRFRALQACAEAGVLTCLVVQPVLPMNVDTFVARTAPWTKLVRIDRMYFGEGVAAKYAEAGIPHAAAESFATDLIARLTSAYRVAGVVVDDRDDIVGRLDAQLAQRDAAFREGKGR